MRNIVMQKGRIKEVLVEEEKHTLMIEDENNETFTYVLSKDTKVMNDEHFVRLNFNALEVLLPVYVYVDTDTKDVLFVIIAQNEDDLFQIIDSFDDNLVSKNKMIKINEAYLNLVKDKNFDTQVKTLLANQQLLVFYHVSTKSIPALVTPVKIIIL